MCINQSFLGKGEISMTILQAIESRHSVRCYLDKKIPDDTICELQKEIDECNKLGNLRFQLVTDDAKAFDSMMAHYGKFSGVKNYVAFVGEKASEIDERIGYYGERIALKAQTLGLNTCWVALTFSKGAVKNKIQIDKGEKLVCVLALGFGATEGKPHKSKAKSELCRPYPAKPDWFSAGVDAAMLAPTAVNQQKFLFTIEDDRVSVKNLGGFYSKVDLGIVKYHFEIGANKSIDWN